MEKSENWYKQFTDKLELSGMSPQTQKTYAREIRLLKDHCSKDPWEITEQDVQDYLLYRKNTSKWAPSTLNVALCGIRYYYQLIHKVNWEIFKIAKFKRGIQLPSVLTREEVDKLLKCVTPFSNYVYLVLVYSCGLRLNEALNIEVSDIDRKRKVIHIHRGKGAKDRYVPLPHDTLKLLGQYWLTHKNKKLMFPRLQNKNGKPVKEYAQETVKMSAPQTAMKKALKRANINKKGVSVHTLSYANLLSFLTFFRKMFLGSKLAAQRLA